MNSRTLAVSLALAVVGLALPSRAATNDAEPPKFRLIDNALGHIDLKLLGRDKGDFGIDYSLRLDKKLMRLGPEPDASEPERALKLNLRSDGFITATASENEQNSIISQYSLTGDPLWYSITPELRRALRKEEMELTPGEVFNRTMRQAAAVNSPLWIFVDAHAKHETTQDFDDYDFAFGSEVTVTTSYLNDAFDEIFRHLRFGKTAANNKPRQLDLTIGYDRVINLDETANAVLRDGEDQANRLLARVEWETGILQGQRFVISYNMHYEIDAPEGIRDADKDLNHFFEIRIDLLTSDMLEGWFGQKREATSTAPKYSFSIKYTNGKLPPNYTSGNVLGAGFSLEF